LEQAHDETQIIGAVSLHKLHKAALRLLVEGAVRQKKLPAKRRRSARSFHMCWRLQASGFGAE
jgi:hypothetical protein